MGLLKENNSTIGKDAVRLTASKIATAAISLATSMLLSRFRTTEEYGTYSQMLLVINLLTSLMMLGLPNSINYFLARAETETDKSKFLSVYYSLSTILSIAIGCELVLSVPLIEAYFHNPLIRDFYYFLALFPWTHIICSSIENILIVYHKTRFLMAFKAVYSLINLGIILVVQWIGRGFTTFMIANVAVNCFFALAVYCTVGYLSGGIRFCMDKKLIKAIFVFSIPIGLASVVGTLNAEIDKLLIGYLMDTDQMAIYTNAAKELPFTIISSSITAVLLPKLSRLMKDNKQVEAVQLWGHAAELAFIFLALIVCVVFVYAEDVISILYSDKYLPGVNVFRVYTSNLLLRITYFGIILNAAGETKKIFWCSIYSLGLNAVLNPLFYWIFGMIGPAIATFVAILVIQVLQLKMTAKVSGIAFHEVFPWKKLLRFLAINIPFAIAFCFIKEVIPIDKNVGSIGESLLLGVVWAAIYLLIMNKAIRKTWNELNRL